MSASYYLVSESILIPMLDTNEARANKCITMHSHKGNKCVMNTYKSRLIDVYDQHNAKELYWSQWQLALSPWLRISNKPHEQLSSFSTLVYPRGTHQSRAQSSALRSNYQRAVSQVTGERSTTIASNRFRYKGKEWVLWKIYQVIIVHTSFCRENVIPVYVTLGGWSLDLVGQHAA